MNLARIFLSFFLIILCTPLVFADESILLSTGEWPPFISVTLKQKGFAARIVTEAFELEGIKVEYQFRPWARAYDEALYEKVDGTVFWSRKPKREESFLYSDPSGWESYQNLFQVPSTRFFEPEPEPARVPGLTVPLVLIWCLHVFTSLTGFPVDIRLQGHPPRTPTRRRTNLQRESAPGRLLLRPGKVEKG